MSRSTNASSLLREVKVGEEQCVISHLLERVGGNGALPMLGWINLNALVQHAQRCFELTYHHPWQPPDLARGYYVWLGSSTSGRLTRDKYGELRPRTGDFDN